MDFCWLVVVPNRRYRACPGFCRGAGPKPVALPAIFNGRFAKGRHRRYLDLGPRAKGRFYEFDLRAGRFGLASGRGVVDPGRRRSCGLGQLDPNLIFTVPTDGTYSVPRAGSSAIAWRSGVLLTGCALAELTADFSAAPGQRTPSPFCPTAVDGRPPSRWHRARPVVDVLLKSGRPVHALTWPTVPSRGLVKVGHRTMRPDGQAQGPALASRRWTRCCWPSPCRTPFRSRASTTWASRPAAVRTSASTRSSATVYDGPIEVSPRRQSKHAILQGAKRPHHCGAGRASAQFTYTMQLPPVDGKPGPGPHLPRLRDGRGPPSRTRDGHRAPASASARFTRNEQLVARDRSR